MKIGILGGTFDPIHMAHLILAETARDKFDLDKVLIMPAGEPYFKDLNAVSDDDYRANMVKLAIDGNDKFEFSDIELLREGNTYTVDTLLKLKEDFPNDEFFLIVGSDTLYQIENWKDPAKVLELATIVIASRSAVGEDIQYKIHELEDAFPGSKFERLNMLNIDISSTNIRAKVKNNVSIKYLVPDAVLDFIEKNGLYK